MRCRLAPTCHLPRATCSPLCARSALFPFLLSAPRRKAAPRADCPRSLPLGLTYSADYRNRSLPLHHQDHWHRTVCFTDKNKARHSGRPLRRLSRQGASTAAAKQGQGPQPRRRQRAARAPRARKLGERKPGSSGKVSAPAEGKAQQSRSYGQSHNIGFHNSTSH